MCLSIHDIDGKPSNSMLKRRHPWTTNHIIAKSTNNSNNSNNNDNSNSNNDTTATNNKRNSFWKSLRDVPRKLGARAASISCIIVGIIIIISSSSSSIIIMIMIIIIMIMCYINMFIREARRFHESIRKEAWRPQGAQFPTRAAWFPLWVVPWQNRFHVRNTLWEILRSSERFHFTLSRIRSSSEYSQCSSFQSAKPQSEGPGDKKRCLLIYIYIYIYTHTLT